MATSSSNTSVPETEYDKKKSEVVEQIRNKSSIKPEDLYILATLLTIYASNDSLPLCLLCRKNEAKKQFQLGHLIPHSILETGGIKYFADLNQGKESGPSNMGYRAFCGECEDRFSKNGETYLNEQFFKPFYEKQDEEITCSVLNKDGQPWLYFSILSIVWRCLCFVPDSKRFLNILEYLRSFILDYPEHNQTNIDSEVTLYVFAPNCELENKLNDDNETYKRFFNGMYTGEVGGYLNNVLVWVFMGPIHIVMKYANSTDGVNVANELDLDQKAQACVIRSTTSEFTIPKKNDRFFPMTRYDWIISHGIYILSQTLRIRPSTKDVEMSTFPPVMATNLFLLPKSVMYSNGDFCIPKFYKIKFRFSEDDSMKIVGALQGKDKVLFVAFDDAMKYSEDGNPKNGPLALALKVDINGNDINVSYQKDVYIPLKEKCGQDLNQHIPYKEAIEELISSWILEKKANW